MKYKVKIHMNMLARSSFLECSVPESVHHVFMAVIYPTFMIDSLID